MFSAQVPPQSGLQGMLPRFPELWLASLVSSVGGCIQQWAVLQTSSSAQGSRASHRIGPKVDWTPIWGSRQADLSIRLFGQAGSLGLCLQRGRTAGQALCPGVAGPSSLQVLRLPGRAGPGAAVRVG